MATSTTAAAPASSTAAAAANAPRCEAWFYDAHGKDRAVSCARLADARPGDDQMLWVDLLAPDDATLEQVWSSLGLPDCTRIRDRREATNPGLLNCGKFFRVSVVAVNGGDGLKFDGTPLVIVAGQNIVVTLHDTPVEFVDTLRAREGGDTDLGWLSAESFTASLLDWHLSTYFSATAEFELAVERLEVDILDGRALECLPELRRLRRAASRLRRMLTPHRAVFSALSRPDFRPAQGEEVDRHFLAIDTRYERAMDMVENARDLVIGSFELFSSQTALQTNRSMSVLTFATVVLGVLAVVGGIMGMNFEAKFFSAADRGFWVAVGGMLALSVGAVLLGRYKRWI